MFFILRKTYDVKERRELLLSLFEIFDVEGIDSEKLMKGLKNETFSDLVVKSKYTIVQNNDAFNFFDGAIGKNSAIWQTAGFWGNGGALRRLRLYPPRAEKKQTPRI